MPVAKSYQKLKQSGEPFMMNKKWYVTVKNETNGTLKNVRWYSDQEYAKLYPEDKTQDADKYYKPQKHTLGFEKGYITIFKGVKEEHDEWFRQSICRFAVPWGWYVVSTMSVPEDLPSGVKPVRLDWEPMGKEDGWLKDEITVKNHVRQTLKETIDKITHSTYQGEVGERLDINIKIIGKSEVENKRFHKFTYTYEMEDTNGNYYKWVTQAQNWSIGTKHHIRGTVKEFDEVNGEEATVLTRCVEV